MKKVTNAKKLLVMILLIGVVLLTTCVYADDAGTNTWGNELSLNGTTTTSPSPSASASPIAGNTALSLNGTTNTNTNTVNTTNTNVSTYNTTNTTNTTSDLPNTGLGDSLPIIALIVVVAISAAYAYKKVQDYQNL